MKANDLRIGNFVIYTPEPDSIKMISGVNTEINNFNEEYQRIFFIDDKMPSRGKLNVWIKPIKITEQWLLNFCFSKEAEGWFYSNKINGGRLLVRKIDGKYFYMPDMFKPINIKYVHKLQNLYFCLTGKELKFNLKVKK